MRISTFVQPRPLVHSAGASVRLLLFLLLFGATLVMQQAPAFAQSCPPGSCPVVDIDNCNSIDPMDYEVRFLLCCDGVISTSPPVLVPPAIPAWPNPCTPAASYMAPLGCVIIGVASVTPPPPGPYIFNPGDCTLSIP